MRINAGKNMSLKSRVNIYYAAVLIVISGILLVTTYISSELRIMSSARDTLAQTVQDGFDDINEAAGVLQLDDRFDSFSKGIILLVYAEDGELLKGTVPEKFPYQIPLESGTFKEADNGKSGSDKNEWLVYDQYNIYDNGQGIYIRGIYTLNTQQSAFNIMLRMILIITSVLLVAGIIAGRSITRKWFRPFEEITASLGDINEGKDLSKRLPLGKNHDELYELTENINSMIERLDIAFRNEKEFTSDVAHELKTPVAVILSECEIALSGDKSQEEYVEALKVIQDRCRRSYGMIQQLLQLARTVNREESLEMEEIDLSMIISSAADEITPVAEEQGVKVYTNIKEDVTMTGDETLIMRMIMNLITNAVKYREKSRDSFVKISLYKEEGCSVLSVEDNGIGIPEKDIGRIFDKFFRVDRARTSSDESYGLGLAMVRWIVEAHCGEITVSSNPGSGTCFTVRFPDKADCRCNNTADV